MAFYPSPQNLDFYILIALVWFSFFGFWFLNTYFWNKEHSSFLQKSMTFMIFFKLIHCVFQVILIIAEFENMYYVWFCHTAAYTLFNTISYMIFLLISQGFGLYKSSLNKKELSVTVVTMIVFYACFTVYSLNEIAMFPLLLTFLATCGYFILKFAFYTTKCLKLRYELLQILEMRNLAQVVIKKLKILKKYLGFVTFHLVSHFIPAFLIFSNYNGSINILPHETNTRFFGEICEYLSIVAICFLFRSKNRGEIFIQETQTLLNYRSILPIYEARITDLPSRRIKNTPEIPPLLITNPTYEEKVSLFVAIPILRENRTDVSPDEVLIQPLLSDVH
ncbi:unnamed protein product [Blepharisma stoltei]|uniref:Uncharacterized protein n=1 Tax=Blepharisma stoltei TaxID=1481888 RepID=A0AAU9JWZ7_9CILI|nr:unnamed protein product [Blepharisma stoltei]